MISKPALSESALSRLFRAIVPVAAVGGAVLGVALPVQAAEIENVSPDVFQCMKENDSSDRGYLSFPSGNSGTIDAYAQVLDVWGGSVDFTYNSSTETLTVTNPQGPGGERIIDGLREVAQQCRSGEVN